MKYKAVIFDMDGVIFDSEKLVLKGWQEIADKYGIKDIESVYYKCVGVNSVVTREIFLQHYGEAFPYDAYKRESSEMFHAKYDNGRLPMKQGVVEILQFLNKKGYLTGVASSTRYAVVKQELEAAGLLGYFKNLTCGDMLKKSKPEPDIYLMACEKLGVLPGEAIAIEDSYNGIRAAYRAGMMPVMVPDMTAPDDEMKRLAGKICDNLFEVKEWLEL